MIGYDFSFDLSVEGGEVFSYISRVFKLDYYFLQSWNVCVNINGWRCRQTKVSVYLAKQYDLIVSLHSPVCIISFSLLLMRDCVPP